MRVGVLVFTETNIREMLHKELREAEYARIISDHFYAHANGVKTIDLMSDPLKLMDNLNDFKSITFAGQLHDARRFVVEYTQERRHFEKQLRDKDADYFIVHTSISGTDLANVRRVMKDKLDKVYILYVALNSASLGPGADAKCVTYTSQTMTRHEIIGRVLDDLEHNLPSFVEKLKNETSQPEQMRLW